MRFEDAIMSVKLFPHQAEALKKAARQNRVAFYHEMGLGKTFTGAEKMYRLGANANLLVCQKSKIEDWITHFIKYYPDFAVLDLTKKGDFNRFLADAAYRRFVAVINYDLVWRRKELRRLADFTLMLDESSMIQNETAKRAKFILSLHPANVILLSGTPTSGKYERLWSQMRLLGWNISKRLYWNQYVEFEYLDTMGENGEIRSIPIVKGYKNVDRLKRKMREYGCQFLKTEDVFDLPEQVYQTIEVPASKEYRKFHKSEYVEFDGVELIGDTTLTKKLYERELCGMFSKEKKQAFRDLLDSTEDRLIVFYNFTGELVELVTACNDAKRPYSVINGQRKDLDEYETKNDSVTLVQYQAGAMGLNLQLANKIVFFSPTVSCELWMQSQKRIHRIGQSRTCFYYKLVCKDSVEEQIYDALQRGVDFTDELFLKGEKQYGK